MALDATFSPGHQAVGRRYALRWALIITPILQSLPRLLTARVLCLLLVLNIAGSVYWALDRQQGLQDLGSFLHSGAAHREGLNPYDYHPGLKPYPISPEALNLNPPVTVYPFDALSGVDTTILRHGFIAGTALIFALGVGLLLRAYPEKRQPLVILSIVSMAGLWHIFGYLQLYAPLFLAIVGAWLCMRRGDTLGAAVLIGLVVAVKPNFMVWPLFLLLAGERRMGMAAIATAAGVSAVPLLLDGPGIYQQWLELTLAFDGLQWASNASLASIGARFGLESVGYAAGFLVVAMLMLMQWRLRPTAQDSSTFAIIAALLLGPASWAGYTLFLLPSLLSRRWSSKVWACVLLLCTPFWLVHYLTGLSPVTNAVFGPVYGWAVLVLLAILVARQVNLAASAGALNWRVSDLLAPVAGLRRETEPAA